MRRPRLVAPAGGVYHVVSRTAFRRFAFRPEERNAFVRLLARVAAFSGVRVLTFAVMSNHFHLLVRVPEGHEVSDEELERRVRALYGDARADRLFARWERWRATGAESAVEEAKARLRARMHDLSQFCKTLKETFTMDYNRRTGNVGGIWGGRFRSVLVAPEAAALLSVGAYVDANPVKAGMAHRPRDYRWAGFADALRGNSLAREGIAELVRLVRGAAVAPPFDEAATVYGAALEGRLGAEASAAGSDPSATDPSATAAESATAESDPREGAAEARAAAPARGTIAEKLSSGEPISFAEMLLCDVPAFSRGGVLGSRRFVAPFSMRRNGRDRTAPFPLVAGILLWTDRPLAGPPLRMVS